MGFDEPQAIVPAPFTFARLTATFENRTVKKDPGYIEVNLVPKRSNTALDIVAVIV